MERQIQTCQNILRFIQQTMKTTEPPGGVSQ